MRHRLLLLAAAMICVPGMIRPQMQVQAAVSEPSSMRFEWVREGPADVCGRHCREWVAASGPITGDTMRDFDLFAQVRDLHGATIVLDSGGGSVLASLDLGRRLRQLGMKTTVGRIIKLPAGPDGVARGKLSPRAECASMCVFVLLGGVQRRVPPEARILVHQIWPGSKRYDASAEAYTAEELVRIQRDVGRIARYTVEMGADIELFELAMRIPPWERLRSLSQTELRRLRLQSVETASESPTSGVVTVEKPPKTAHYAPPERGWTLASIGPQPALQRLHSLTVEGDEIGQFKLTLACTEAGSGYRMAYFDTRASGADDASARLKEVTLRLGGDRISLKVKSSAVEPGSHELKSTASGHVTKSFVERLRTDASSVIVVGTRTTDNASTSIRVGGTGFAKAYPRFAENCRK